MSVRSAALDAASVRTTTGGSETTTFEPIQVKSSAASGSVVSVALDEAEGQHVPGNLLVLAHSARHGEVLLPGGFTTAYVAVQDPTTTCLAFKHVTAGDPPVVAVTSSCSTAEQTLTVMEFEAVGDDSPWTLDSVSARRTDPGTEVTSLSTGPTDVIASAPQLAVAVVGLSGGAGGWDGAFGGGFAARAAVASDGPAADRSALAVGTRRVDGHVEVETSARWRRARGAAAILAALRAGRATDSILFARPGIPTVDSLTVVAQTAAPGAPALVVSKREGLRDAVAATPIVRDRGEGVVALSVSGLEPDTEYHWGVRAGGRTSPRTGRLVTAPAAPKTFTFVVSSCGGYRQNASGDTQYPISIHPVWDAIFDHAPAFFVHLGDLHYQDVNTPEERDHLEAYTDVFSSVKQGRLWRRIPMAHMWGDHDYCGDNSYAGSPGRDGAAAAFRRMSPQSLAWPSGQKPVSYAFSWGPRVRVILPDCRYARSHPAVEDTPSKTMLGAEGKAWLLAQLASAEADPDVALICLSTEVPWISSDRDGDDWSMYATERAEIASYIDAHLATPILGLGGDAHMTGFDDGTNNAWGGFPVLQASALDRCGSIKGGPYSSGAFPNPDREDDVGQFALVMVVDDGRSMEVEVSGRRVTTAGVESTQFTERVPLDRIARH